MKENIKKISLFFFLLSIFSCNSAQINNKKNVEFYKLMDRVIDSKKKINYIGILFIKNCDREIAFSVESRLYDEDLIVYKVYKYKGYPVFYFSNATDEQNDYAKRVLDLLLRPSNYSINNFEKKSQSSIYGEYAYFKNGKFIENKDQISKFFENCKSLEP